MARLGYPSDVDLENLIEDGLSAGRKPEFAIAYALIRLAKGADDIAHAIHRLGTADAATPMGAIEVLSGEVGRVADAMHSVADAVSNNAA